MKEFLVTILDGFVKSPTAVLERKNADQKFFSVSGMGFGQQPLV
jgi:hypothetical protein